MGQPLENYDDASIVIRVDPVNMAQIARGEIIGRGETIAGCIDTIHRVWDGLSVGWVGETADQARQFSADWSGAIQQLFGTRDAPDSGVLTHIVRGVVIAAVNYDQAELAVTDMFSQLSAALGTNGGGEGGGGEGGGGGDPQPITEGPIIHATNQG